MTEQSAPAFGRGPRDAAVAAWNAVAVVPTSAVPYQSAGDVLIVGPRSTVEAAAAELSDSALTVMQVIVGEANSVPSDGTVLATLPSIEVLSVTGYLGALDVSFKRGEQRVALSALAGRKRLFDLILDLNDQPILQRELPPPGYMPTYGEDAHLAAALEQLPDLIGEFEKPKFFDYNPDICAHGERGITGCTRCIDVCPAEAIISIGERVEVNPNLCQGAGSCSAVCPTGAISYAFPPQKTLFGRLRGALGAFRNAGGMHATVLFYGSDHGAELVDAELDALPDWIIPAPLEEIGMVGLDVAASALAYGAEAVAVFAPPGTAPSLLVAVNDEMATTHAILKSLGHDPARMQVLTNAAALVPQLSQRYRALPGGTATHAAISAKRTSLHMALDHLWHNSETKPELAELPDGASFGSIEVAPDKCTLCMGCVTVCPTQALADAGDTPALQFTEMNCVQCGLCERACPEDAVTRTPRLLFDPNARRSPRTLHAEQPFHCIRCAKPFANASVVERMTEKLRNHRMFAGEALERLQMCENCRAKDMFNSSTSLQ